MLKWGCPATIIVSYPPTKLLNSEEQDLVWKFRYYLTTQEKVCVCVCVCVGVCVGCVVWGVVGVRACVGVRVRMSVSVSVCASTLEQSSKTKLLTRHSQH